MSNHFYKPILLIILISAFFQFTPIDVEAHKSGYTYQAWAPAAPTIDGNIDSEEWKYAATGNIDFGGGYTGTFYVMNDASNLYIAAKIADDDYSEGSFPSTDGFYIQFDNDNDGVFPEARDEYLYVSSGTFKDGHITDAMGMTQDINDGGTSDGTGAMANGGMELVPKNSFELSHPIDSADDTHDFSLSTGSTAGFRIRYHDDVLGYTDFWPGDTATEFGDIVIASAPPTFSAFTSTAPTIDGTIDVSSEWASASTASINFGWTYSGTVYVMNDEVNLYVAAKIADDDFSANDFLVIVFDNDNNGVSKEDGEDQLQLVGSSNFGDNFYQGESLSLDTGDGGTLDGDARASGDGSFNYYEFTHPLDSADDAHDISLSAGSTVGFKLQYRDETSGYWSDWSSSNAASWAKITVASGPDFSITADPPSITVEQGASGTSTITIGSINGFNEAVTLSYSWLGVAPSDVTISLAGPVTPPPDGSATSMLQVSAGGSATVGTFTLNITGSNGGLSHSVNVNVEITATATTPPPPAPGCVIATATYGSEMADEVVYMRNVRDQMVGSSQIGRLLVNGFNGFYYLWSPSLARFIASHDSVQSIFRVLLLPLIGISHMTASVYSASAILSSSFASVVAFIFGTALFILAYIVIPIIVILEIYKRRRIYGAY